MLERASPIGEFKPEAESFFVMSGDFGQLSGFACSGLPVFRGGGCFLLP